MRPREKDCNQPRTSMHHWKNFPTCGVEIKERAKLTWYSGCSGCILSWWSWPEDPHSCPLPPCKAQSNAMTSHASSLDQKQASEMFNFLTFGKNTASKGILTFQNTLLFTLQSQPAIHWSDLNISLLHQGHARWYKQVQWSAYPYVGYYAAKVKFSLNLSQRYFHHYSVSLSKANMC